MLTAVDANGNAVETSGMVGQNKLTTAPPLGFDNGPCLKNGVPLYGVQNGINCGAAPNAVIVPGGPCFVNSLPIYGINTDVTTGKAVDCGPDPHPWTLWGSMQQKAATDGWGAVIVDQLNPFKGGLEVIPVLVLGGAALILWLMNRK